MQKTWTPTARQSDFISLPDEIFEGLYGGAAGGGKTETLLMLPVVRKSKENKPLYEYPRFKALYLRRTYPELKKEVIPRSREIYPHFGFQYNGSDKVWTHDVSGAMIQFGHCEHENDVKQYDTTEYNIILWDEATSFTDYIYEYISFSRCRTSSEFLPKIIRAGTNPGNIGHSYFRHRFVEPAKDGNQVLREVRKVQGKDVVYLRIFIPSKVSDNPYLQKADPDYINRLNLLPPSERAAKAEGDWWTFSGQVFDDWRVAPFPNDPPNARHVVEPFDIPAYWPKILSIDWGFSAMTIAGWYAINPCPSAKYPAKIYKYREYSAKKTKISTWASDVRRLTGNENLLDVVLDPSAWQERGDPTTIAEQFATHFGRQPRKAHNNRIGGKLLLQELLRWKARPARFVPQEGFDNEVAAKIKRMSGDKDYESYCALFQPEKIEEFLPQFQIFETCKETKETIPLCVYDKDRPEDVAEFNGDDPYDETRYGISACQNYLDGGIQEAEQADEVAKVCSLYEQSGDINRFYRQMATIDSVQAKATKGHKRFHGRKGIYANFRF